MTIDPDDYDLRELRRIADERRDARDPVDDSVEAPPRRRADRRRERGRQSDHRRQNGHGRHRNGRSGDHAAADDVTVRPREGVDRSHRGDSEHARDDDVVRDRDDDVVRADRIARDLGFGDDSDGRDRNGRADRRMGRRPRRGTADRSGFDADDVGRFQFDTDVRERPRSRPGKALRNNQLEQLLVHETAASGGLSKPYLTGLPDAYAAERLIFDWLEFLVLKGGYKRTMDALRYYRTVGWVTDEVEVELRDYLVGFSGDVSDTETYDVADHHLSLVYIARLASMT